MYGLPDPYSTVCTNFQNFVQYELAQNYSGHVFQGKEHEINSVRKADSGYVFQGEIGTKIEENFSSKGFGFREENSISIVV